ncbi:uncharacterized protein LOC143251173 isoform X2 [Tachypleus tridentatus]|uniref:uncharacterized protein LOC143251173 isoform X2 n=1 Tax=Tachypleus tridentatus TaxID=6853 RepID=UPI003FD6494D
MDERSNMEYLDYLLRPWMKSTIFIFIFFFSIGHGEQSGRMTLSNKETLINDTLEKLSEDCDPNIIAARNVTIIRVGVDPTLNLTVAIIIFTVVGIFASAIASFFHVVRKHVYHDADNLDTTFDAGGKVSIGLTATTIVSQWTWSATLLQSSTVASKYGISGPYWYAAGATIQVVLFAILSIQLKTRAPGAKTFLQVIKARFGKTTHITFCVFACCTNIVVAVSLTLAGVAVLHSLIKGLSMELAVFMLTAVIGGYTLIGGLGATFYVSYFNTAIIFIILLMLVIEVYHNPLGHEDNLFGSSDNIYRYLVCSLGPEGNRERSYLTFLSSGGFFFGIINIVGNFGTVFCDQSYWQSSVAAKPIQGVWGFILGGLTWFAIPFSLATTLGLSYLALSSAQGEPLLTPEDVDRGLVVPVVAQNILGSFGEYAMIFLILMAVMSTGSAEVIAVASLIIYDIYQPYIQPFRTDVKDDECIICGKPYPSSDSVEEEDKFCHCKSMVSCIDCQQDTSNRTGCKSLLKPHFTCPVHKEYREYQEQLLNYKNWCIMWTTIMINPLFLVCYAANVNLSWSYLFTGVLISSTVIPITLSVLWSRLNEKGMIVGAIGGCICGLVSWLVTASTFPGGLRDFLTNTGKDLPMLIGNVASVGMGGFLCIVVSLVTSKPLSKEESDRIWEKTRNIDNPLNPWTYVYREELDIEIKDRYHDRPSLESVVKTFKTARTIAYGAGILLVIFFIGIWPGIMVAVKILDSKGFLAWTSISRGWTYIAAAFIIVVPCIQEIRTIQRQYLSNKKTNGQ